MLTTDAARDTAERRSALRRPASAIPTITGVRLSPGVGECSLVNLSSSGALLRCKMRMLPDTPVTLVVDGGFSPASIKSRVVRCLVTDISTPSGLWYHIGVAFDETIAFGDETVERPRPMPPVIPPAALPLLVNRW